MIELRNDVLAFSFPDVHPDARVEIELQRTLRIPDDGRDYPLPPGLGRFPLRHVDDFAARVPAEWSRHGGVMLPMYQAEALWLSFRSPTGFPFAVKVATGKINAVTGERWRDGLNRGPQDYVTVPGQPWLDGYCVEKGYIRQFVAMPLGAGYTAEEQITGEAEHGGLQIAVHPMKREAWERIVAARKEMAKRVPPAPMFVPQAAASAGRERLHLRPLPCPVWSRRRRPNDQRLRRACAPEATAVPACDRRPGDPPPSGCGCPRSGSCLHGCFHRTAGGAADHALACGSVGQELRIRLPIVSVGTRRKGKHPLVQRSLPHQLESDLHVRRLPVFVLPAVEASHR
jgi:hypothetical protein